ncbi:MAG TPA: site-specific integrase [Tepidisphaeraceae bacterium]|nr:site-specific integrase [Tepidisphaeraceae bacterium]
MPRPKALNPKYCRHKPTDRAFVRIGGRAVYLGKWNTQASRDEYARVIGEWIAQGRRALPAHTPDAPVGLTITELIDAFYTHARSYYIDAEGNPGPAVAGFVASLRPLQRLYGRTEAAAFGPKALKVVRESMIEARPDPKHEGKPPKLGQMRKRWSRQHVNAQINSVRHVFKWAAENELVPVTVHQALATVGGLKRGKTAAPESKAVRPVADAQVDAALPFLSTQVAALLKLQRLTGARGGELCIIRTSDIDRAGNVWLYQPRKHKTQHHGTKRIIRFGPQGQTILQPFLKMDPDAFLFSPAEADVQRRELLHERRKTPESCGNTPGSNRRNKAHRRPGERYTANSYANAIKRACDVAFPPPDELARRRVPVSGRKNQTRIETPGEWKARLGPAKWALLVKWRIEHRFHPHQVRHAAATRLRAEYGIDVAQTILGHRLGSAITEIYAEADTRKAEQVIAKIG